MLEIKIKFVVSNVPFCWNTFLRKMYVGYF